MTDYINREDAIKAYAKAFNLADDCIEYASVILKDIPPADVVEVVRCKDCKFAEVADANDSEDGYICQFHRGSIWFSGSYCSWGERADE